MNIEFLLTSLIVILVPGTGVIYTVSAGLTQNRKAAMVAAIGCTLGIVPHLLAGIIGISALMHTSALIFRLIRYAGVAYLTYMGIGMLRSQGGLKLQENVDEINAFAIIRRGILINLLNPKLTIFFLSFLPQFIHADSHYRPAMIWMSLQFMVMTLLGLHRLRPSGQWFQTADCHIRQGGGLDSAGFRHRIAGICCKVGI